jgi:hypothetical protein
MERSGHRFVALSVAALLVALVIPALAGAAKPVNVTKTGSSASQPTTRGSTTTASGGTTEVSTETGATGGSTTTTTTAEASASEQTEPSTLSADIAYIQAHSSCWAQLDDGSWTMTDWLFEACRYSVREEGSWIVFVFTGPTGETRTTYYDKPQRCWAPSATPVTATTTWSRYGDPTWTCAEYRFRPYQVTRDSIYIWSDTQYWAYRPAAPGEPVAFSYDGHAWTYDRTGPSGTVTTDSPATRDGSDGF